jgi:hypothetical protein
MPASGIQDVAFLVMVGWLFVAVVFLPYFIKSIAILAFTVLIVSPLIFYGLNFISPMPISTMTMLDLESVIATGMAMLHRAIIEPKRTGRWPIGDK